MCARRDSGTHVILRTGSLVYIYIWTIFLYAYIYLGRELSDCFTEWVNESDLSPAVQEVSCVSAFPLTLHIIKLFTFCQSDGLKSCITVLICIYLLCNDFVHLFVHLLNLSMFLLVSSLLAWRHFSYILDISISSVLDSINDFSQLAICVLTLFTQSFSEKKSLILTKCNLVQQSSLFSHFFNLRFVPSGGPFQPSISFNLFKLRSQELALCGFTCISLCMAFRERSILPINIDVF